MLCCNFANRTFVVGVFAESSFNRPFDRLNAWLLAALRLSHELQNAPVKHFLIQIVQPVAEECQYFLLGDRGGEGGVEEAVKRDALLLG
jgi:hypothetical protein